MSFLYAQQRVSEKLFKSSSPRSGREPRIPLLCFLPWKVHFYVHFAAFILRVLPTSGLSCRQGQSCQPMAYPVDRARAPTWILTLCHVSWLTYFLGYSLVLTLVFQSGPSRHWHRPWTMMGVRPSDAPRGRQCGRKQTSWGQVPHPPLGCCALYLASPLKNWRKNSFNPPKACFIESRWLVRILQD